MEEDIKYLEQNAHIFKIEYLREPTKVYKCEVNKIYGRGGIEVEANTLPEVVKKASKRLKEQMENLERLFN